MVENTEHVSYITNNGAVCHNNRWYCYRLCFLTTFMAKLRLSAADVAKQSGYSRQNIHNIISSDDAKISALHKIFNSFGYSLEFTIDDGTHSILERPSSPLISNCSIQLKDSQKKRLSFLTDAMYELLDFYPENICKKSGLTMDNLRYWIKVDDCKISDIFKMIGPLEYELLSNISPIEIEEKL